MKFKLSLRKLFLATSVGVILSILFSLQATKFFDFVFIRWEFIFPPIIAIFYLSLQPYLNYADAKTYFVSGAQISGILALFIILVNALYEMSFYGRLSLIDNFGSTMLSYILFTTAYAVLGGFSHYIFNKNVDPAKPDIYRYRYIGYALLVGGFAFVIFSLIASARISGTTTLATQNYEMLIPVVVSAFLSVRLHNIEDKDIAGASYIGAVQGLSLGLSLGVLILLVYLALSLFNPALVQSSFGSNSLISLFAVILGINIIYTFLGACIGLGMKILHWIT